MNEEILVTVTEIPGKVPKGKFNETTIYIKLNIF
jgi:hypothetical protein